MTARILTPAEAEVAADAIRPRHKATRLVAVRERGDRSDGGRCPECKRGADFFLASSNRVLVICDCAQGEVVKP